MKPTPLWPRKITLRALVATRRIVAPRPYHVTRAEIENNPAALAGLRLEAMQRLKVVNLTLGWALLWLGVAYVMVHELGYRVLP